MADNNAPQQGHHQHQHQAQAEEAVRANGIQINPRDRLFHAIFIKVAIVYVRLVPKWFRTLFEILVLAKALILFTTLSYIHFTFSKNPMDCLQSMKDDWPRDGVLQVQIMKNYEKTINIKVLPQYFASERNYSLAVNSSMNKNNNQCPVNEMDFDNSYANETSFESSWTWVDSKTENNYLQKRETTAFTTEEIKSSSDFYGFATDFPSMRQLLRFYGHKQPKDHYIMEYALEYGFLRLSQQTRERLKIPVKVVTLDPKKDKCFGDSLSRFILDKVLGYDDLLMGSIKRLAERNNNQGYMKNVMSGENYKFVAMWMGRTSYIVSFLLMFLFTVSISTLLRFCHQQIFIFIVHLLHVMDWNISYAFPIAPLFTVILSLVGMEAIMAEFFNDTTTSFYVILMVWAADQFDSICCHTKLSQKFWPRFFFLYHFVFYAYHYRFNGQYSSIALASSWFFIQHSMLYFLHNYEIPAIQNEIDGQGNFAANYLDDAVDLLVDEIQFPVIDLSAQVNQVANDVGAQQNQETTQEHSTADNAVLQQNEVIDDPEQSPLTNTSGAQRNQEISNSAYQEHATTENSGSQQTSSIDNLCAQNSQNNSTTQTHTVTVDSGTQQNTVCDSGTQHNTIFDGLGAHQNMLGVNSDAKQSSVKCCALEKTETSQMKEFLESQVNVETFENNITDISDSRDGENLYLIDSNTSKTHGSVMNIEEKMISSEMQGTKTDENSHQEDNNIANCTECELNCSKEIYCVSCTENASSLGDESKYSIITSDI